MVIDKIDGPISQFLEVLELVHDVLRASGSPFPLIEHRDVTKDARPGTASGCLHRREPLHRQHSGHVERHGFDELQWEAFTIRIRPPVKIALNRLVGMVYESSVLRPRYAGHALWILEALDKVEQQLFAVATTGEIHFGALQFDQLCIQRCKNTSERRPYLWIRRSNLPRQDLGIRIAGGTEKAKPDESRLLSLDFFNDDRVRCIGVRLVKHDTLMAGLLQDRRQRHDPDRREPHDASLPVHRPRGGRQRIKLGVADMDQEDAHRPLP